MKLLRLGYSAVDAATHIRPHWGPTNTQLKAHLGLIVPRQRGGERCTTLTVGGETREWKEGRAELFDDSFLHEVWNNCSSERLILQAVFVHPDVFGSGSASEARKEL